MKLLSKNVVKNASGTHVMTQITLIEINGWALRLHKFYAEDNESFHSHPRGFISLCISGSYTEYIYGNPKERNVSCGSFTFRRATAIHRVVPTSFPCTTIAFVTPIVRRWSRELSDVRIVLIGATGSGKGTQGAMLAARYGCRHISIGDVCRHISSTTTHPLHDELVNHFRSSKNWQPLSDELACRIAKSEISGLKSFVLDGFPRNEAQAAMLDVNATNVIYLDIKKEVSMQRVLSRKRKGDTQEKVELRLHFDAERLPKLSFTNKIDASQGKDDVFAAIINTIEK